MTGIEMAHVPYRSSGPALTDLFSGQVQVMIDAMSSTIEHIKANRLRPLAVTSPPRSPLIPDTPVMSDFVPGYEVSNCSFGMPRNTPPEVIDRFNIAVNEGFTDSKLKAQFASLGGTTLPGSPADSASSSPTKPRSGARLSGRPISSRSRPTFRSLPAAETTPSPAWAAAIGPACAKREVFSGPISGIDPRAGAALDPGGRLAPGLGGVETAPPQE